MKSLTILCPLFFLAYGASGQNLFGSWQLVKEITCIEEAADAHNETLRGEMHSQTSASPRVVTFRENASGEESMRILNRKRTANPKKFYYKFNGEMLLILDKKSQTITDSYLVEKFTTDSLIVSNAARPCETRIFLKLAEGSRD